MPGTILSQENGSPCAPEQTSCQAVPTGCRGIENAIANCYLDRKNSCLSPIFNALATAIAEQATVLVPFEPDELKKAESRAVPPEDVFVTAKKAALHLRRLTDRDGSYWTPLFTGKAELEKGPAAVASVEPLSALLRAALGWKHCQGVQLNPWGSVLMLDKKAIEEVLSHRPVSHISLMEGDITRVHADAIVNAANESLLGGGGVDGAIHRAAGAALLAECRTLHGCKTGCAKLTKGYALPAKYVIHTVGPVYTGKPQDEALLASCYRESLALARANGCRSVAFPCIATGVYGYPAAAAARVALQTVVEWFDQNQDFALDVYFCCFDAASLAAYRTLIAAISPAPQDVQDLQAGEKAYQEGRYETAIRLYTAAAKQGNVTAMSNLGYCYYYGRNIPVDKAKAHEWWQRACELGDVCATYKLGDMYRRGDLPKDEVRACALYRRAYTLALQNKELSSYPDACLRIVKFDAKGRTQKELCALLHEARLGFEARIRNGDRYTDRLLADTKNLQQAFSISEEL